MTDWVNWSMALLHGIIVVMLGWIVRVLYSISTRLAAVIQKIGGINE